MSSNSKPNVLIIMVDQLNFRTLGCYRKKLPRDQALIWGQNTMLETPFLDSLAAQGLLFTNFYTVSPTCTPSRASFITGNYPHATGATSNNKPLFDNVTSFAHILKQHGYYTAYIGKWHLYGEAIPGWGTQQNNTFGFTHVSLQYNRGGASKVFLPHRDQQQADSSHSLAPPADQYDMYSLRDYIPSLNATGQQVANESTYLTDFLIQKTMDVIVQHDHQNYETSKQQPFAIMLSIPDPHPPYAVRSPYNTLYQDVHFDVPQSMEQTLQHLPQSPPKWAHAHDNFTSSPPMQELTRLFQNQRALRQYFGMIKCLDDNVGKLLSFIESYYNNTVIVFTSDHGGLLGEHALQNKGKPYKTSAGVPFIIKYPPLIPTETVIHTPTANIDFTPTLLSLLNITIKHSQTSLLHGQDLSLEWIQGITSNRTIYLSSPERDWIAAVNSNYKLVLSTKDQPWLFDLVHDPHEMKNYYKHPLYKAVASNMRHDLLNHIERFIPSHILDTDKILDDDMAMD